MMITPAWLFVLLCALTPEALSICFAPTENPITMTLKGIRNDTSHSRIRVELETLSPVSGPPVLPNIETELQSMCCGDYDVVTTKVDITVPKLVFKPPGYESFLHLGHYKMYTTPMKWHDAFHRCEKDRAHLLIINKATEAGVVKQLHIQNSPIHGARYPNWYHAGHQDYATNNEFYSIKGERVKDMYNRWYPGEPNNKGDFDEKEENCGSVHESGLLGDTACNVVLPFICELER